MTKTKDLVLSAGFISLGLILPFITGQIPEYGNMLLPMHIPVLLCGLICNSRCGLLVGFITPILRGILFGMPVLMPRGLIMACELATYGFVAGYLFQKFNIYISLISTMIAGRIVYGIASLILLGYKTFTFPLFIAGAITNAIPGILLQILLIPSIIKLYQKSSQ